MIRLSEGEFARITSYMSENYGINLNKKKILIECRMTKELEKRGLSSFSEYLKRMEGESSGELAGELVNRLTTNYTYFFREPEHFKILKEKILPEMYEKSLLPVWEFWCAGCSTGEECYTLAMAVHDFLENAGKGPEVRILGTDVSENVLEQACRGRYSLKETEGIPALWRDKYCHKADNGFFVVDERLRQMVRFRRQNLIQPVSQRDKFALVMCRNVMIYFDKPAREKVVRNLEASLAPGGYLFTGHAELLSQGETVLNNRYPAVYQKKGGAER